ncbi:hypothetical protein ACFSTA_13030 [Ornithinibacillus salinisoli]|uniref:Peptidase M50 domain-containing protein n=1 Tax=Ornithinibacillus salinisoli TaxID=1848459 RepID=A0ABW4W541_9BACI
MDIYILLYLFLIAGPLSTLIHEAGHLVGASLLKADQITLSFGSGRKMYSINMNKVHIFFQPSLFISGATMSERNRPYNSVEVAFISLCGPLCNILFFTIFTVLYQYFTNDYLFLLIFLNGWFAIINIIPFKVKEKESDGYIVMKQLFKKKF